MTIILLLKFILNYSTAVFKSSYFYKRGIFSVTFQYNDGNFEYVYEIFDFILKGNIFKHENLPIALKLKIKIYNSMNSFKPNTSMMIIVFVKFILKLSNCFNRSYVFCKNGTS